MPTRGRNQSLLTPVATFKQLVTCVLALNLEFQAGSATVQCVADN